MWIRMRRLLAQTFSRFSRLYFDLSHRILWLSLIGLFSCCMKCDWSSQLELTVVRNSLRKIMHMCVLFHHASKHTQCNRMKTRGKTSTPGNPTETKFLKSTKLFNAVRCCCCRAVFSVPIMLTYISISSGLFEGCCCMKHPSSYVLLLLAANVFFWNP